MPAYDVSIYHRAPGEGPLEWIAVGSTGWTVRLDSQSTATVANRYGLTDHALRYPHNGVVVYDFPERIPKYVRRAVARLLGGIVP